jgi:hypothetical protein
VDRTNPLSRRAFALAAATLAAALAVTATAAPALADAPLPTPGATMTPIPPVQPGGPDLPAPPAAAAPLPAASAAANGSGVRKHGHRHLCAQPTKRHQVACHAIVSTDDGVSAAAIAPRTVPPGYGPADLRSAYGMTAMGGPTATVAIVDAYNDPNAESDLAVYRAQYGLPACTTANGCFKKTDQRGGTRYPADDTGWAGEISLDLDMVSAICPGCHILLVEADQADMDDLGAGVNEAVALGAKYVSNSYGGAEDPTDPSLDAAYYTHPGVAITASAGDSGYGAQFPAAAGHVTAVGGTSLVKAANTRGWTETVWSDSDTEGTGSGCSADIAKPSWQTDKGCPKRMIADVSAVSDPDTGVAVYDSFGSAGWSVYGGTSAAAPIIASVYALAGTPGTADYPATYPYKNSSQLWDVTGGGNGTCPAATAYFCTAAAGYDGPTGLGTPHGTAAFAAPPVIPPIVNGGFETGTAGWTTAGTAASVAAAKHSGSYGLQLGSTAATGQSTAAQTFTAPAGSAKLAFWYRIACPATVGRAWATGTLADATAGTTATPLAKTCVKDSGWLQATAPLVAGHKYTLTLLSRDDGAAADATHTYFDDVAVS